MSDSRSSFESPSEGAPSPDAPFSRRQVLTGIAAAVAAALVPRLRAAEPSSPHGAGDTVAIESFSTGGQSLGVSQLPKVVKSEAEWRSQLSPLAFGVTREAGTERAFSGEYAELHANGLYRCICCDTALFDSRTKFESGTGWPSFWQPISRHNVTQGADDTFGMSRTAVSCRRCDAHLGHVFDDGPRPTGLRYCMNSVALHFIAHA